MSLKTALLDIDGSPYDLNTYQGRRNHFIRLTSPFNLLETNESLMESRNLISSYRKNPQKCLQTCTPDQLWKAKYALDATFHPDTGEKVPLPFRMAAFVPMYSILTAGLLIPNPAISTVIFWQWLNQSLNVGVNWSNANKSTQMSIQETALAYGSAVTASVSVAVGLKRTVQGNSRLLSETMKRSLARFVPFVAVASASSLNVFLMRRKELVDGIDICDEEGKILGKSKAAGWNAVSQVAISRVATALPCLTIPPLFMARLERTNFFRGKSLRLMGANLVLITASLMTALPAAIAVFPQRGSISASMVESEFRGLKSSNGKPIEKFYFNKGL